MATPAPQQRSPAKFVPSFEPATIALKFAAGKPVNGFNGQQILYALEDGRRWYTEPHIAQKIAQMRIQPGEPFEVFRVETKRGNSRIVDVEISAIVSPPPPKEPAAPHTQATAGQGTGNSVSQSNGSTANSSAPASVVAAPAAPAAKPAPRAPVAPMNGNGETGAEQLARCYRDAIDIAILTVEHGKKVGLSLAPCFEDIRCMAAVMAISGQQGGRR